MDLSFTKTLRRYPPQFQLMFWGMLLSTVGTSMIWPFLMIYVSERLKLPLSTVTFLMTINAGCGLIASFLAGPIADKVGRKWIMVFSLVMNGLLYLFMSQANSLPAFMILMACTGAVNPLYRVGTDAMVADLIPRDQRVDAYALQRLSNNLGISIGPVMGGLIASSSYTLAFLCAATGLIAYGILITIFAVETLPKAGKGTARANVDESKPVKEAWGGYLSIIGDGAFMRFVLSFALVQFCAVMIWVLMPVYAKTNYQVSERLYGWIPTTNALMVVFLQLAFTSVTKKYQPLHIMALGAFFYAIGVGSVSLAQNFWGFWLSMVVMTTGELMLVPTSSTYAANLAPPDKRGRYMSIYGLTWGIASGLGPLLGGILNDNLGPKTIWYGGLTFGLVALMAFLWIGRLSHRQEQAKLANI